MKFSIKTDYALRTMQYLARHPGRQPVAVKAIGEEGGLSIKFLQSMVSRLRKSGLLLATTGPKGGIALARRPEAITLLDIIEAVEGPISLMSCFPHPADCSEAGHCTIVGALLKAQNALLLQLRQTTLQSMVEAGDKARPAAGRSASPRPEFLCPVLR